MRAARATKHIKGPCINSARPVRTRSPALGAARSSAFILAQSLHRAVLDDAVRVLDCRSHDDYLAGHIPGAVALDWHRDLTLGQGHLELDPGLIAPVLEAKGVSVDVPVVVCGTGQPGDWTDAKVWWALKVHGHPNVRVLVGGMDAWTACGFADELYEPCTLKLSTAFDASPRLELVVGSKISPGGGVVCMSTDLGFRLHRNEDAAAGNDWLWQLTPEIVSAMFSLGSKGLTGSEHITFCMERDDIDIGPACFAAACWEHVCGGVWSVQCTRCDQSSGCCAVQMPMETSPPAHLSGPHADKAGAAFRAQPSTPRASGRPHRFCRSCALAGQPPCITLHFRHSLASPRNPRAASAAAVMHSTILITDSWAMHGSTTSSSPNYAQDQPESGPLNPTTCRRQALGASLALGTMALPGPAHALKAVTLRDGTVVDVFEHGMSLSIVTLKGTVPADWILHYKSTLGKYAGFTVGQRSQIQAIYTELSDPPGTKNSAAVADVVSLGDAWLAPAVRGGLLRPIPNAETSRWWRRLSPRWRALLRRGPDGAPSPSGNVYAAPYRWGATLIAYRRDRLLSRGGVPISDWRDLLQPELAGQVAMTGATRDFLGAALKASAPAGAAVGFNASVGELAAAGLDREACVDAARALWRQVRLFSSRDHVRAFVAGDVLAVVGWAHDIITLAERSNSVEVVMPASGTALFADVWAVPSKAQGGHMQEGPSPLLPSWLEFSLMPARTSSFGGIKTGATPLLLDHWDGHPSLRGTHEGCVLTFKNGYMPGDPACLHNSEFLLPLDEATQLLYKDMLAGVRSGSRAAWL